MPIVFHFQKESKPMNSEGVGLGRPQYGWWLPIFGLGTEFFSYSYLWSTFFQPVEIVSKFQTVYCLISWIFLWSWLARRCSKQPWKETDRRQAARPCTWVQRGARGKRRHFEQTVDSHVFELNENGKAAFYDLFAPFHDHCSDKFRNFSFIIFPPVRATACFVVGHVSAAIPKITRYVVSHEIKIILYHEQLKHHVLEINQLLA